MENSYFKEIDAAALCGAVSGAYGRGENAIFRLSDFEKESNENQDESKEE